MSYALTGTSVVIRNARPTPPDATDVEPGTAWTGQFSDGTCGSLPDKKSTATWFGARPEDGSGGHADASLLPPGARAKVVASSAAPPRWTEILTALFQL